MVSGGVCELRELFPLLGEYRSERESLGLVHRRYRLRKGSRPVSVSRVPAPLPWCAPETLRADFFRLLLATDRLLVAHDKSSKHRWRPDGPHRPLSLVGHNSLSYRAADEQMSDGGSGNIDRVLGHIEGLVERFSTDFADFRKESKENNNALWIEIRNVKHEARGDKHEIGLLMDALRRDIEEIRNANQNTDRKVDGLTEKVTRLSGPVEEYVTIRRRATALWLVLLGIGSFLWATKDTLLSWGTALIKIIVTTSK